MADNAILFCTQTFNRSLRHQVESVSAKTNHLAPERIECMTKQQEFATGIDVAALPAFGVPRVTDLDAINRRDNVVISCGAYDFAAVHLAHRPWKHRAGILTGPRVANVRVGLLRFRNCREPQFPQPAISRRRRQSILMLKTQRLQANAVTFERDGIEYDHLCTPATTSIFRCWPLTLLLSDDGSHLQNVKSNFSIPADA